MALTVRKVPSCSGVMPARFTAYSAMYGTASDRPKPRINTLRASPTAWGKRSMAPRPGAGRVVAVVVTGGSVHSSGPL
ncbi:hypothetical protein GCM10010841_14410 [Deinococcus aerophilus]|uniref:Uncharacterized protein n=1 Tax=Deinococcus aerophilus TaxID=522488 RepID=A0ABQ2GR30_9DEIO|nr:hypothetical protein GCM10010841_14410 [Deinococcus aerophilus]